jgi:flagellar basal-body rod protein FlgB
MAHRRLKYWVNKGLGRARQNSAAVPNIWRFRFTKCLIRHGPKKASSVHSQTLMFDALSSNLERYMDLLSARQKLVVSNIANADTPGYKTRDIDFQGEFRNAITASQPQPAEVSGLKTKNDGNNVNIDRESRLLAENDLRFSIASNLLRSRLKTLRSAIEEKTG